MTKKMEDNLKNKTKDIEDLNNCNNFKNENNIKNEDNIKNKDNLKNDVIVVYDIHYKV